MERVVSLDVVKTEIDGASVDQQRADGRVEAALHVALPARFIARIPISAVAGVAKWTGGLELCLEEPSGAGGIAAPDVLNERGLFGGIGPPELLPSLMRRPTQPRTGEL